MKLTDDELELFTAGTLLHCGEPVVWTTCDIHKNCMDAMCCQCGNTWCDTNEGLTL